MIRFLQWMYNSIPFIQLFNNRFNILGFIWFASLTILTYICLKRDNFSFGLTRKKVQYLGILAISIFTVWVFYRSLDELLTIFTVLSWDPSLLSFSLETLTFWFGKLLSYSIILIGLYYLFNSLKIKIFKMEWFSWLILFFVAVIQRWSLSIFKVDYAVLTGAERITVFWNFYPLLYISYAILYISLLRNYNGLIGVKQAKKVERRSKGIVSVLYTLVSDIALNRKHIKQILFSLQTKGVV